MNTRKEHGTRPGETPRARQERDRRGLEIAAERYRRLFHGSPLGMIRESNRGEILEVNQALLDLLGHDDPADVVGRAVGELYCDAEQAEKCRARLLREGSCESRDVRLHRASGDTVWVQESSVLVPRPEPSGTEILRTLVDIDERRERERSLERMAYRDPLTGLANRRLLQIRAEQTLALADRRSIRAAMVYLDLLEFKKVNDDHGHATGDSLLVHVGSNLEVALRAADTAARVGGDEFAVLLSEVDDRKAARAAAERLLESVRTPLVSDGCEIRVEARAGVALFPDDASDFDGLLNVADAALIRAKDGNVQVVVGPPEDADEGGEAA